MTRHPGVPPASDPASRAAEPPMAPSGPPVSFRNLYPRYPGYTPRRDGGLGAYETVLGRAGFAPVAGIDEGIIQPAGLAARPQGEEPGIEIASAAAWTFAGKPAQRGAQDFLIARVRQLVARRQIHPETRRDHETDWTPSGASAKNDGDRFRAGGENGLLGASGRTLVVVCHVPDFHRPHPPDPRASQFDRARDPW